MSAPHKEPIAALRRDLDTGETVRRKPLGRVVTRRILIVTAQFAVLLERPSEIAFRNAMLELALLTVVALVVSLLMLRKRAAMPLPDQP